MSLIYTNPLPDCAEWESLFTSAGRKAFVHWKRVCFSSPFSHPFATRDLCRVFVGRWPGKTSCELVNCWRFDELCAHIFLWHLLATDAFIPPTWHIVMYAENNCFLMREFRLVSKEEQREDFKNLATGNNILNSLHNVSLLRIALGTHLYSIHFKCLFCCIKQYAF